MSKLPKRFDPGVLDEMTEPLSLRVERRVNNMTAPIELPPEEDQEAGGVGLTRDRIRTIEAWLVNHWAGGGFYTFICSDSSDPKKKMEWVSNYDPRTFPPKSPPTMIPTTATAPLPPPATIVMPPSTPSPAPALAAPVAPPAPSYQPVVSMSSWPMPSFSPQMAPVAAPAAPPAQPFYYPANAANSADANRQRELERQNAELQQRAVILERQALDEKHARDLERVQRENDAKLEALKASLAPRQDAALENRFSKLESVLEKIVDRLAAPPPAPPPAPAGPSPELTAMLEANKQLQARLDRQEEQRQQEQRDQQLRAELKHQIDAITQQTATMMTELRSRPQGPDPMIEFMRSVLTNIQLQMERMQNSQMTPLQIAALIKESSGGIDEVRRSMSSTFTDIFSFQKQAMEAVLQLQPQGESPTVRMIEQGLGRVGDLATRFLEGKSAETLATQKTQRALIDAQVQLARPPAVAQAPVVANPALIEQAAAQAGGLNGPSAASLPLAEASSAAVPVPSNVIPIREAKGAGVTPPKRTDAEWFGSVAGSVLDLRSHVHAHLEALTMGAEGIDPTTKEPFGMAPARAAAVIMMATGQIIQAIQEGKVQLAEVPAFTDLLMQERFMDFLDVLLPAPIPQSYRDEVMQALEPLWEQATKGDDDDKDDADDKGEA